MIAKNYRRFPEALVRQLELALTQAAVSAQGIAAAVARAFALLPAGTVLTSVPTLREPEKARRVHGPWRALNVPASWWWQPLALV